MVMLVLGLVLFLGAHSTRIFVEGWRTGVIARVGEKRWKGMYSLISAAALVLLIWGYGQARQSPIFLWTPPQAMRPITALLMMVAFVLFVAPYVPRNGFKSKLHHPQLLSVKVWALAHLLANGTLADLLLFGSFMVWAVLGFRAARRRDRASGTVYALASARGTLTAVAVGLVAWTVFGFWLHGWLIGVRPFG